MARARIAQGIGLCLLVAGCAVGPDYERPEMELPTGHRADPAETPDVAPLPEWREVFQDETLQSLIELALSNNLDLASSRSKPAATSTDG